MDLEYMGITGIPSLIGQYFLVAAESLG